MSLGTTRFHPTMSKDQMVAALNANNAAIENINITQTFKDDSGTPRIIIGRMPDGTYGIVISKPNVDINTLFKSVS